MDLATVQNSGGRITKTKRSCSELSKNCSVAVFIKYYVYKMKKVEVGASSGTNM
jgi:hypothetical protein